MTPTDDEIKALRDSITADIESRLGILPAREHVGGGYVFPQDLPDSAFPNGLRREGGLTLRDYFAAQIAGGMAARRIEDFGYGAGGGHISGGGGTSWMYRVDIADAYRIADKMLAERAKCAK